MNQIPLNTPVAAIALANIDGVEKTLLLKRAGEGYWCHVAGKVESGETGWQAIIREFREETGIEVTELYSADYIAQFYDVAHNCIRIVPVFVAILPATTKITLNYEHTEYKWCSLEEAKSLTPFPNQWAVYDHVWRNFIEREPSALLRIKISE